ncbi:MAG: bacillithiol system redox-active protein YtxJ [Bacteroidota bacterium]|jgi:bacillithiol system protein YtxJ
MNWHKLEKIDQLVDIDVASHDQPVLIFKHSTRCSISSAALSRLERSWNEAEQNILPYYLDLLQFRNISNALAEHYKVEHQSPQVLLVKNGKCIYHESHMGIAYDELLSKI